MSSGCLATSLTPLTHAEAASLVRVSLQRHQTIPIAQEWHAQVALKLVALEESDDRGAQQLPRVAVEVLADQVKRLSVVDKVAVDPVDHVAGQRVGRHERTPDVRRSGLQAGAVLCVTAALSRAE
jgi:hypothetical protein